jgi:hypothetical protein
MDEPVRSGVRPARCRGLTRPDPVTAQTQGPAATRQHLPSEKPGQAAEKSAAGKPHPENHQDHLSASRNSKTRVRIYAVD